MQKMSLKLILKFILVLYLSTVISGCNSSSSDTQNNSEKIQRNIQNVVEQATSSGTNVQTAVAYISSPKGKAFASSGTFSPDDKTIPKTSSGIRVASIGKMFTAATTLKLVEKNLLKLDDTIKDYLAEGSYRGLSLIEGKDLTGSITIRQLLQHTSGLSNYFTDGSPVNGIPPFLNLILNDPDRLWSIQDTIDWTRTNLPTRSAPGNGFWYSDTNYQILGLIIEAVTKKSLAEAAREQIFEPVGMKNTYEEFREVTKQQSVINYYFGSSNVTRLNSLSSDYAGGGWITTPEELASFLKSLVKGKIISSEHFGLMSSELNVMDPDSNYRTAYGLGMEIYTIKGLGTFIGHTGFFKSLSFYWVEEDTYIMGALNQSITEGIDEYSLLQLLAQAYMDAK